MPVSHPSWTRAIADVLAHLLNGTLFNYVLLGTVNDPAAVGKIILIPKPVGNEAQAAANVQPNMQQQNYPAVNQPTQGNDESGGCGHRALSGGRKFRDNRA
jgi:hypothetical protein